MASDDATPTGTGPELVHDRFLRATIADGQITLNPPLGGIIRGGPASMTLARLEGVVIVDLRTAGEDADEVVATVPPNAPPLNAAARRLLAGWAALVGHERLWLPDRVIELEPQPLLGPAFVRCPTCTSVWADSSEAFWSRVRSSGHFPGFCPACGGSLPEWRPARAEARRPRRALRGTHAPPAAHRAV